MHGVVCNQGTPGAVGSKEGMQGEFICGGLWGAGRSGKTIYKIQNQIMNKT